MTYRLFESEQHASTYVRTRPCPPASLIDVILNRLEQNLPRNANNRWPFAVDVGAGSGQNTFMIKDHFDSILGVDISEAQINEAEKLNQFSNIIFKVSFCLNLNLNFALSNNTNTCFSPQSSVCLIK